MWFTLNKFILYRSYAEVDTSREVDLWLKLLVNAFNNQRHDFAITCFLWAMERLQCHPGKSDGHVFGVSSSVTECYFLVSPVLLQNVNILYQNWRHQKTWPPLFPG